MDKSNIAYLLQSTITYDEIGQIIDTVTQKQVYCNVRSISRDEFYQAGQKGLRPKWAITMFQYDYENEEYVKMNISNTSTQVLKTYHIYRSYIKNNDEIELYLEETVGISNG